ncbi:MAG: hypothetical protein U1E31_03215 [Rickettsiales bacterium]
MHSKFFYIIILFIFSISSCKIKDLATSSNSPFIEKKRDFKNKYQPIYNKKYIEIAKRNVAKADKKFILNSNFNTQEKNDNSLEFNENDTMNEIYSKEEYNPQKENRYIYRNMIKTEQKIKENSLKNKNFFNTEQNNKDKIIQRPLNNKYKNMISADCVKKDKERLELQNKNKPNLNCNSETKIKPLNDIKTNCDADINDKNINNIGINALLIV